MPELTVFRNVGLGRRKELDARDSKWPMARALPARAPVLPRTRRWRLVRKQQQDQGNTPHCVAFTGKHWELALPTYQDSGKLTSELYHLCKQRDSWPNEDGTDARTLLKVYQELGLAEAYLWGNTTQAIKEWVGLKGPVWFGCWWWTEMFLPAEKPWSHGYPVIIPAGQEEGGHEVLIIGYKEYKDLTLYEILNSWGLTYGRLGRTWISEVALDMLLNTGGDAVGVTQLKKVKALADSLQTQRRLELTKLHTLAGRLSSTRRSLKFNARDIIG